jgi:hypothetical protein
MITTLDQWFKNSIEPPLHMLCINVYCVISYWLFKACLTMFVYVQKRAQWMSLLLLITSSNHRKICHLMEVKPFGTSYFNNVIFYFSGFSLNLLTTLVIICVIMTIDQWNLLSSIIYYKVTQQLKKWRCHVVQLNAMCVCGILWVVGYTPDCDTWA